jgi:hypothetical protein
MASQTPTQRKASAQKAAATRRRNAAQRQESTAKRQETAARSAAKRSQSAATRAAETRVQAAETRVKADLNTLQAVQAQAERAVLIPVGAALEARDTLVEAVGPFTEGRDSAERELNQLGKRVSTNLRKYERRGTTARNRAVREVKRARTKVERELRQRRGQAVRTAKRNRRDFEKQVRDVRQEVQGQAEGIVDRVASIA